MIRRVVKYTIFGTAAVSAGFSLHANNYDVHLMGFVRLGRSAVTAFDIAYTYKRELYYRSWDKTSTEYKTELSRVHDLAAEKILTLICANKGVYIKVGQHIGALEYLLPKEFVNKMKVLHSNAPTNPVEDLYKVIQKDLKLNPDEIFDTFDREPLGTASLAQVHKATLKRTGEIVAVKVQHPYVKANSLVDIKTMELLVNIMSYIFPDFSVTWLVNEMKQNLPIELDFLHEGRNAEKVAKQFEKYSWLKVPKIHWDLSCDRILVMEYLDGGHVTDIDYIKANDINVFSISNKIGQLYSEMIFKTGFVHSDPHPGNLLVKKNTKNSDVDIILLDHGLYATLTDQFRYDYSKLWLSILNVDKDGMRKYSINLGVKENLFGLFACMVAGRPWDTIEQGVSKTKYTKEEKSKLQNNSSMVLSSIADVLAQMDRQMLLIMKTNDLIRGIEATLGTQNRMTAFWVMSKCCVHNTFSERKRLHVSGLKKLQISFHERWTIFKLNVYYMYLGLINFGLITVIKELL